MEIPPLCPVPRSGQELSVFLTFLDLAATLGLLSLFLVLLLSLFFHLLPIFTLFRWGETRTEKRLF